MAFEFLRDTDATKKASLALALLLGVVSGGLIGWGAAAGFISLGVNPIAAGFVAAFISLLAVLILTLLFAKMFVTGAEKYRNSHYQAANEILGDYGDSFSPRPSQDLFSAPAAANRGSCWGWGAKSADPDPVLLMDDSGIDMQSSQI